MKLPIKKKYFDEIKEGKKDFEVRDAHITFVCEETGETLRKDIESASVLANVWPEYADVLEDEFSLFMRLKGDKMANKTIKLDDVAIWRHNEGDGITIRFNDILSSVNDKEGSARCHKNLFNKLNDILVENGE